MTEKELEKLQELAERVLAERVLVRRTCPCGLSCTCAAYSEAQARFQSAFRPLAALKLVSELRLLRAQLAELPETD